MKKNERLMDAIGDISKEYVNEAAPKTTRVIQYRKRRPAVFIAAAACAALLLAVPVAAGVLRSHQDQFSGASSDAGETSSDTSDVIIPERPGYGFEYHGFSVDVSLINNETEEREDILNDFDFLFRSGREMVSAYDAYYNGRILCVVWEDHVTLKDTAPGGLTFVHKDDKFSYRRIAGSDSSGNVYVISESKDNGTVMLQAFDKNGSTVSRIKCDKDMPVSDFSGFDSISTDESGHILILSYSGGTVKISEEEDGRIILSAVQGDKEQLTEISADGQMSLSPDSTNIFSFNERNTLVSESGEQKISFMNAAEMTYNDSDQSMTLQYRHNENTVVINGSESGKAYIYNVNDTANTIIPIEEAEGLSEAEYEKICRVLRRNSAETQPDIITEAVYIGGNEEKGYVMIPGAATEAAFYSFDMNGDDTELIGTAVCADLTAFSDVIEVSDSMYYNGSCYGITEYIKTNGTKDRILFSCDENGKTGYTVIPADMVSDDDILCIRDGEAGFLNKDEDFYKAEFVYAE